MFTITLILSRAQHSSATQQIILLIQCYLFPFFGYYADTYKDSYVPTIEDTYRQVICCNKVRSRPITKLLSSWLIEWLTNFLINFPTEHMYPANYRYYWKPSVPSDAKAEHLQRTRVHARLQVQHPLAYLWLLCQWSHAKPFHHEHSVTLRQSLDELIPIYKLIKEVKGEYMCI